jgi:hypothetical protein
LQSWGTSSEDVSYHGCAVVQNLSIDDDNKVKLCNAGACQQILEYLKVWGKTHSAIARNGCGAIANLTDIEITRKALLKLHAIEILESFVMVDTSENNPRDYALKRLKG